MFNVHIENEHLTHVALLVHGACLLCISLSFTVGREGNRKCASFSNRIRYKEIDV